MHYGNIFEEHGHNLTLLQYHMPPPVLYFYITDSSGFSEATLDLHHLRGNERRGEENNESEV